MSEQVPERGIDRTPDTLTELENEKLRADLEALFSSEGAEAGWVALGQLIHGEEQEGDAAPTPPAVTGEAAYQLVMAQQQYFPENFRRYFNPNQQSYDRRIISGLEPDVHVSVYGTDPVYGRLKDSPRALTHPGQPFQLEVALVDHAGEVRVVRANPGQFTIHPEEA